MPKELTSKDLDRDPDGAMSAALAEHVIVLEAGKPAYVLVSNAEYERLTGQKTILPDAKPAEPDTRD